MITFDAAIVFITLIFILLSFYRNWAGPSLTFFIAVITLMIFGILKPNDIMKSFANEQVAVVIMLLLLGEIIRDLGILQRWFDLWFKKDINPKKFLGFMMLLVGSFSAFFNNTPLVAIMMPYVSDKSRKYGIMPSKLLIPLSYIAILGGCVTLIGTSTNLIVNGMIVEQTNIPQLRELEMFDFVYVGLPMLVIGFLYLYFFSHRLLPERKTIIDNLSQNQREYIVEAYVKPQSNFINKTLLESQLRGFEGLNLIEIIRGNNEILEIYDDLILKRGDKLLFAGDTQHITDILMDNTDLGLSEIGMMSKKKHLEAVEIVISHNSTLISKSVKEANFRVKFDAVIIAIHRNGERLRGKLTDVRLKPGDVLLLITSTSFFKIIGKVLDFYVISRVKEFRKIEAYKSWILIGGTLLAVILASIKLVPLLTSLIILIGIVSILKITNPKDMAKKVDFNLALTIILALAFGTAMIKTNVAEMIAIVFNEVFNQLGIIGMLFGIYFINSLLAAYITNKAAVAIMFPIALALALRLGVNPEPFMLTVAFSAAANFITPIGYQTNLMVYGPGGYLFKDFLKIGLPLTIMYMIVCCLILWGIYFS